MFDALQISFRPFTDFCAGKVNGSFFENCRLDGNFLEASLLPFEFISGGYIGLVFWGVLCLATYLKYHNFIYSALTGVVVLLTASFLLPSAAEIYVYALISTGVAVTIFMLIWKIPRD